MFGKWSSCTHLFLWTFTLYVVLLFFQLYLSNLCALVVVVCSFSLHWGFWLNLLHQILLFLVYVYLDLLTQLFPHLLKILLYFLILITFSQPISTNISWNLQQSLMTFIHSLIHIFFLLSINIIIQRNTQILISIWKWFYFMVSHC